MPVGWRHLSNNAPASWSAGPSTALEHGSRLPTRAIMVRSPVPSLREPGVRSPIACVRDKSIHPLVGNIRLGPKLQRAGALQDASALSASAAKRLAPRSAAALRRFGIWLSLANQSDHGSFPGAVCLRELGVRSPIQGCVTNPFARSLAISALGQSSRGLEHSRTLARLPGSSKIRKIARRLAVFNA